MSISQIFMFFKQFNDVRVKYIQLKKNWENEDIIIPEVKNTITDLKI